MSVLKNINVRPVRQEDLAQLDMWRRQYPSAFLELPKGVRGPGVETTVAEKNYKLFGSLTAISAVVMDPCIFDPTADGLDIYTAVYLMERTLAYRAQDGGAADAYIAVPNQLTDYHAIVEKSGYMKTCENCTIFRRPLRQDTVPLIETENT